MKFSNRRKSASAFTVFTVLLFNCLPVYASLDISLGPISAISGSTESSLDVLLTNTDPTSVTISAFSFELGSLTGDINFTEANTASTLEPYIFSGHSLFGPTISTSIGQVLDASDLYDTIGLGATLGAGSTMALGHVLFDVAGNAGSPTFDITISGFPATSLSDPNSTNIPITNPSIGTTVPVPGTLPLVMLGLIALMGISLNHSKQQI